MRRLPFPGLSRATLSPLGAPVIAQRFRRTLPAVAAAAVAATTWTAVAGAVPSGPHPRLFMSGPNVAASPRTLGAIAIGDDGGADGHLWAEATTDLFPSLLVG